MLKVRHTYRVALLCERIARNLRLSAEDVDVAWLCGLLHDLGRFEQVKRYHSFNDANTINHAQLSASLLFDEDDIGARPLIRKFIEDDAYDALIRTAIEHHSDFALPDGLDEQTLLLCHILRDADKIDILRVNVIEPDEVIYRFSESEMSNSPVSEQTLRGFYEHRTLMRDERTYPADFVIGHICFVYGLVFPESLALVAQQGYLKKMLKRSFENEQTAQAFREMRDHLKTWFAQHEPENIWRKTADSTITTDDTNAEIAAVRVERPFGKHRSRYYPSDPAFCPSVVRRP